MGPCQVIEVNIKGRIYPKDFSHLSEFRVKRILFKTNSFPNVELWQSDFNSLSSKTIDFLSKKGVCLIGIDTPSVDPFDDKKLETHLAIHNHDMAILENLDLSKIKPGNYDLIALPLRIECAEASPVRAILLPENSINF